MPPITFKYRINELLNNLTVVEYRKALHIIPAELGISEKTFANYRSIRMGESRDIPHEKVARMELLFSLSPGTLLNYELDTVSLIDKIRQ